MIQMPDFRSLTQFFSDEAAIADLFSVSTLVARLVYHQNFDFICVAFCHLLGYASLHDLCTTKCPTPTPLHSLPGNPDANVPNSGPLRCDSRSDSRHISPATCPRLVARSALEHNRILRQQREELCPPLTVNSTVLSVSGFIDSHGAMERKQRDGFTGRWSHVVFCGGSSNLAGALTQDVSSTSSSFREHRSQSRLHPRSQPLLLDGLRSHRGFTNTAINNGISTHLNQYPSV